MENNNVDIYSIRQYFYCSVYNISKGILVAMEGEEKS